MARLIIIGPALSAQTEVPSFRYVLWVPVPARLQTRLAQTTLVSAVPNATQAEIDAIHSGAVYEIGDVYTAAPGTTWTQIETAGSAAQNAAIAALEGRWTTENDRIEAMPSNTLEGRYRDETGWH